jgi:hypothetical protein
MVNKMQNNWRGNMLFALLITMLVALFISRVFLSIAMIGFVGMAVLHKNFLFQLRAWFKNYFLFGLSLLFFIPLISYFWSDNITEWADVMRVKLPLLFFPLAFAGTWQLNQKRWQILTIVFLILVFISSMWSFAYYLGNFKIVHEGYLKAQVIPTPFENDHIRYSWLTSIAVLLCLLLIEVTKKTQRFFLAALALWFIVYLHVLSARTGLICLYFILFAYLPRLFLLNKRRKLALIGLFAVIVLPFAAWALFPTFQNRVSYFLYDVAHVQNQQYLPGSNDGSRALSIKAGWNILQKHPIGVGAGDVFDNANEWYRTQVPNMLANDKLFPSSEWLIYGCVAGWLGVMLFTATMVFPFLLKKIRHRFFWCMLHLITAFSFLFDIGLESQYGIFLYVFVVLWWWKWFTANEYQTRL